MKTPHYKELARQQEMQRQMYFRIRAAEKLSARFGYVATASMFFYRPLCFDVMIAPGMRGKLKQVRLKVSIGNN